MYIVYIIIRIIRHYHMYHHLSNLSAFIELYIEDRPMESRESRTMDLQSLCSKLMMSCAPWQVPTQRHPMVLAAEAGRKELEASDFF